ncbi:MAG: amidohydrolase family protein [Candidatus Nezhaarchaeota archaeon]|nr:amidohydrolase family protein [Candidatus Nezhaarchaeota archaeon]
MKIDFHNHFYPKEYFDEVEKLKGDLNVARDSLGRVVIEERGMRVVTVTEPMYRPELRIKDMDEAGVDVQVLSLSIPNVYFASPEDSVRLAERTNNAIASVVEKHRDRFVGFASVPLLKPDAAVDEARRAVKELGMKGFIIGSNVKGRTLDDPMFMPFYEAASRLDVPILIHPMPPLSPKGMEEYRLAPIIGFEFDVCLAVARLIFSGVLEKYPLKIIVSHLGAGLLFLFERIEYGYRAYPECREKITKPPSFYLKNLYYDTVAFHKPALVCAYMTVGSKHMVLGSDYPHVIGDARRAIQSIEELDIPEEEKEDIFSGNGRKLLKAA